MSCGLYFCASASLIWLLKPAFYYFGYYFHVNSIAILIVEIECTDMSGTKVGGLFKIHKCSEILKFIMARKKHAPIFLI